MSARFSYTDDAIVTNSRTGRHLSTVIRRPAMLMSGWAEHAEAVCKVLNELSAGPHSCEPDRADGEFVKTIDWESGEPGSHRLTVESTRGSLLSFTASPLTAERAYRALNHIKPPIPWKQAVETVETLIRSTQP